jgi:predicted phage replisome organizer
MADVKWIKITTDIFDDEKILLIESLPDSYAIITVWFKLLCLAGKQNNSGVFMLGQIAYTDKMLATIFRMKESTVTMALQTFEQFGMIEIIDGVITIPNWGKHQNLDQLESKKEYMRNYMKDYREKQKLLTGKTTCKTNSKANVSQADKDIDKELDKELDSIINNTIPDSDESVPASPKKSKPVKHKFGEFKHVMLTEKEHDNLANSFGFELRDKAIKFLDEYIEEKGYKSKSHNLAIRRWVIDAVKDQQKKKGNVRKEPTPKWMAKNQQDYDFDDLERALTTRTAANDPDIKARADALKQQFGG